MRRADQKHAEVAGIVRIGHAIAGVVPNCPMNGRNASHESDEIMRGERQNRVLHGFFGERRVGFRVAGDSFRRVSIQRHANERSLSNAIVYPLPDREGVHRRRNGRSESRSWPIPQRAFRD